jgi:hypothetical protein
MITRISLSLDSLVMSGEYRSLISYGLLAIRHFIEIILIGNKTSECYIKCLMYKLV